jgi:erythromycin esterase-like protein
MTTVIVAIALLAGTSREVALQPGEVHEYTLRLQRGESVRAIVRQQGVDVVVELRDPTGKLLDVIDGPTGRNGDEQLEIFAGATGDYSLRIRPYDKNEPAGKYTIVVEKIRDVAATRNLLRRRSEAREEAAAWLRARSGPIESAKLHHARVIGIGEATHGSRELGDARLALTRRLVEKDGYRTIAVEASADRMAASEAVGWIGRRTQQELMGWVAARNASHPDDRVRIIGVDGQDNARSRAILRSFLHEAYGDTALVRWNAAEKELAAADEQTAVFGDSSVDPAVRQYLFELLANLALDAPILEARHGRESVNAAQRAATNLAQFADFNAGARDAISHSRDWYMAANVLEASSASRVVYWAHNAHVAVLENGRTTGAILRGALQCDYLPIAITFGEGGFVAQLPNDPEDRLMTTTLPAAPDETIESVLATTALTTWDCKPDLETVPQWLRSSHPMHWIGGLWATDSAPSAAFRPFNLLKDFDGIIYVSHVTAEAIPTGQPHVAPRHSGTRP